MQCGMRYAEAAIATLTGVVWAQALSQGTSAQKAELVALPQALSWGNGWTVNIYNDNQYAFATARFHSVLYQEQERRLKIRDVSPLSSYLAARKTCHHPLPRAPEGDLTEARGNRFTDAMAEEQPLSQDLATTNVGPQLSSHPFA